VDEIPPFIHLAENSIFLVDEFCDHYREFMHILFLKLLLIIMAVKLIAIMLLLLKLLPLLRIEFLYLFKKIDKLDVFEILLGLLLAFLDEERFECC
jgi:hypothetical protein